MAWQDLLQDASFRGVAFGVLDVDRSTQRAIAIHELPYQAGAELEDLNLGPRRVRLRAFFWGDDYESQLASFIEALEAPGAGELVHPVHGAMTVLAETWTDQHEAEHVDAALVDVTFVEDAIREDLFTDTSAAGATDAVAEGAQDAREAADDALGRYIDGLPLDDPLRLEALRDAFSQAKDAVGQILSVTGSVGLVLSNLDPLLYPVAYVADLAATVDRAFQGLAFGGRNESYATVFPSFAPGSAAASGLPDYQILRARLDPSTVVLTPLGAAPSAQAVADVAVVQAHARVHAAVAIAEAAAIVLAGELDQALLNRNDIEALAGTTRAGIQLAIDGARAALDSEARGQAAAALSALAWQVQEAARAVINLRPPLVQRSAPVSGPLRLVAHVMYGDAARATELAALNALGRAVLVNRGDTLYAYAR